MSLYFNYDNSVCNEGSTPVIFSYDPSITSLKELLIYELSQLSYYEEKLREIGEDTEKLTDSVINYISLSVVNLDFRKDRFLGIIKNLYNDVQKALQNYKEICQKKKIKFERIMGEKLSFERKKEKNNAVNFGEKQSLLKNTVLTPSKKLMNDIVIMLLSNACLCITELENYEVNVGKLKYDIPKILKTVNYDSLSDRELKKEILNFAKTNYKIMSQLYGYVHKKYGPIKETNVDLSIRKGKCILVSGHYYKNLEMLLDAVKDENINVYTHNDMLNAHAFSYFHKYKNLIGHYQRSVNNLQLDFSSFPGAVLITKNTHSNFDIIRGRIFTPDNNPAYGLCKISENDFSPLIKAAKEEKGFLKNLPVGDITVGYNEDEIKAKINTIIEDFAKEKYKHLFIIGTTNYNNPQNKYFIDFLNNLPKDCYVISLSYNMPAANIWHIESFYDMSLIYFLLDNFRKNQNILKKQTTVFIPQCHLQTISHALNIKNTGVKNIFLSDCCPKVINPSLISGMNKLFGIKKISGSAEQDLRNIIN
ncbi:MAG: hypothetical protein K6C94_00380 [Candidatus Gastranaerophilales bacterium]|nr:hypothetical protein [Candidatus Gastranaerophilales bacterium]